MFFSKVSLSKIVSGVGKVISAIYSGDSLESTMVMPPNFEALPIAEDKALLLRTDKNGKLVCIGVPLETDIKTGEARIKAVDSEGNKVSQVYLKDDGTIEVGLESFKKLVNEEFKELFNGHSHLSTAVGTPVSTPIDPITLLPSLITESQLTQKLKGE